MRFITLASITDQTLLITPRFDGQVLRLGMAEVVTEAEVPARVFGTGTVEISEGYWDDLMIVDGEYDGPYRDGDSYGWRWDGAPHHSASSQFFAMNVTPVPVMEPVPHNRIVVEGLPDLTDATTVNVLRMTTDGETVIRGGWQIPSTTAFTVDDVEAPFGVETRYRLELFDSDGVSLGWTEPTEPVTLDFAGTLIQNCLDADLNATVIHMAGSGQSHARSRGGEVVAAPNRAPYWVGSGVRTVSTRLIFRVYDEEERSKLAQLMGGYGDSITEVLCMRTTDPLHLGSPFYMLATQPETHGVDWRWGGDITESVWDVVEVQPPGLGLSRALLTWNDVMATYPTWSAVMGEYASWAALMQDRSLIGRT